MKYDFKAVEKKYRPIPFWSWNEKLDTDTTRRQVRLMDEAGLGGYFMHARGGLITEYMGEEWFDNVDAACDEGSKLGMYSWAYDENGWPSGFGAGRVNGLGEEYQQKFLRAEPLTEENRNAERTILIKDGYRYYYTVNEFYVDCLDKKVIAKFIEEIYGEYEKRCGNRIEGFFTDEPQISRGDGHPWSFVLEDEYKEKYGVSLIERIDELFFEKGDYVTTRVNFYKLCTELFSESYFKQIYDWCESRGYKLTGHLVCEESLPSQVRTNGACMPHYEYFSIPGMDWLGRRVVDCLTPLQLGSAAAQTGKRQVLSETFAASGHNIPHSELKRIYEWQMVRGVNLLCTHLEGYTMRGIRKRDYPPAMYYQQPWWEDMKIFFDSMSRVGRLLAEGEICVDTLVLHPQATVWSMFNGMEFENGRKTLDDIRAYHFKFIDLIRRLEDKHIQFHLGDDILMERHGRVEDGKLIIGKMAYTRVIIPEGMLLLENTRRLIDEFVAQGGLVTTEDKISHNPITEINRLTYTRRRFEDFDMHYFVNTDDKPVFATFSRGNKVLNIETGELSDFYGSHSFAPYESLVLIDTGEPRAKAQPKPDCAKLDLLGEWKVTSASYNSITLDTCDYSFDGGEIVTGASVLDILPRINELRRPVSLWHSFSFTVRELPSELYLATETPEIFEITVNGKPLSKDVKGFFRDESFKLIDIRELCSVGVNRIEFRSVISQSEETYNHLANSWAFESMKNCLSYDMEVEQIYIVGDFGAELSGGIFDETHEAYRTPAQPEIVAQPRTVDAGSLHTSGYPEFAGRLTLEREITVEEDGKNLYAELEGIGVNSLHLAVNGEEIAVRMFPPYRVELSPYLKTGKNTLTLTVINNLRNMQGPLHRGAEIHVAAPDSFYRESNVFRPKLNAGESCHDVFEDYYDDYCLVKFGLK